MSTKIYDAYEWKGGGIAKLFKKLQVIKEKSWKAHLARQISDIEHEKKKFNLLKFQDDLRDTLRSHQWLHVGKNGYVISNPSSSAVIYFYKDRVFVQFFGLPREAGKKFLGLTDFHFQNQCDLPKGISPPAWKERQRIWDEIFKDNKAPSQAGLSFDFFAEVDCFEFSADIFKHYHGHRPWGKNDKCKLCKESRDERAKAETKAKPKPLTKKRGAKS